MIDTRHLLQFDAVARSLSFSAAARELGVAQPWLSTRIRKLEDQLGFTLFERTTRQVTLTRQGRELAELVAPLARMAQRVEAGVREMRQSEAGTIRIGCAQLGEPDRQQAQLLARFAARYPSVRVEVSSGAPEWQLEQMRRGLLDFALLARSVPLAGAEWEERELYRVALAVMMHAEDPLAGLAAIHAADLAGRRVAMFGRSRQPDLFDHLNGPLVAAGARLVEVPELRRSLLARDAELVVTTIVAEPVEAVLRHGVVRREVEDVPDLTMRLVRHRDPVTPAAERLWTLAGTLFHDEPGDG
jgi:DNA-binding transcriptional LysR family regulator